MCNDPIKIHKAFNNNFVKIDPKLPNKIKTTNSYTDYIQNQLPNSLVMEETTCAEIFNIRQNIKSKSSTEFDKISTQLMTGLARFRGKTGFRQGSGNSLVFTGKSGIYREICGNNSIIYITTG
jgi:hypothetical protein